MKLLLLCDFKSTYFARIDYSKDLTINEIIVLFAVKFCVKVGTSLNPKNE